jgi:RHS repeat-associated protein
MGNMVMTESVVCASDVRFTPSRYTGKERDTESGNDYFGARYYASTMGRFLSPDPSNVGAHPANPQTWNMYSYGLNNPLSSTDPTGMYVCADSSDCSSDGDKKFADSLESARIAARASSLSGQDYADAMSAVNSYGGKNADNGVTVNIGATGGYPGTTTATDGAAKTSLNPTGQNIQVTINSGLMNSGDSNFLAATVAHEGSHVKDAEDWAKAGFTDAANPTHFDTEYRAYGVTTTIMQGFGATRLSASFNGQTFPDFWMKNATDVYNKQIGRPAMIKVFYPNWAQKAFQKNTQGGGQQ